MFIFFKAEMLTAPITITLIVLAGILLNALIDVIHHGEKLNHYELAEYHQHFYKKSLSTFKWIGTIFIALLISLIWIKS